MKRVILSSAIFVLFSIFSHSIFAQHSDPRWERWNAEAVTDSTFIEGFGVLEYTLYRVDATAGETNLMKVSNFPDAFMIYLEECGYIVDYSSRNGGFNSGLSENVKRLMARHRANISVALLKRNNGGFEVIINIDRSGIPRPLELGSNVPNWDIVTFNIYQKR